MKQSLFEKLEIGMPVSYLNCGIRSHTFYFKIVKINKDNQTVDIERYLKLTDKPDAERKIYKKNISLADIEFLDPMDKLINLDPTKFFPK